MSKKIIIDAPKHPVVRYKFLDERRVLLDLRGIRNLHSPLRGRTNPSKGQKRRFLTPEHLQAMVEEYFESCNGPMLAKDGTLVRDNLGNIVKAQVRPYTLSGLALYLGISTETLRRYRQGRLDSILDEMQAETGDVLTFSRVVSNAKQRIEAYAESRLYDHDGQRGAQFVLDCCYGWVGAQERANIEASKINNQIRQAELAMKQDLLNNGEDTDFTINIVRKQVAEEE